jgi:probable addiction module antidote protein
MQKMRTLEEYTKERLKLHPEEIESFIQVMFEEYAKDKDAGALLSALRIVAQVQGVGKLAQDAGITRNGLQKALSEKGNPRLNSISGILESLGYHLTVQRIE